MANYQRVESEAQAGGAGRRYRVSSPVDLQPIGEFEAASREAVRGAVERARKAQLAWAGQSFADRAALLQRLIEVFIERQDEMIDCVVRETGKARAEALAMEVFAPCVTTAYYAKRAAEFLQPEQRTPAGLMRFAKKLTLIYKPLGVVGLITPWNAPVVLAVNPLAQALMAGNAVVHKPSEVTPFSAVLIEEFTRDAGFPEHLYQVLQGDGQTGADLIEAGVDKISFTGSVATGRKVGEACGRNLIPATLELGGKDAMIVCADADLDRAAEGAVRGACWNSGHYCCSTERVYVPEPVYEPFVQKVVAHASALRQRGDEPCDVGAVFWDRQMEIIESHMADAKARGAKVLVGGRRNPALRGSYFEPTVLVDVNHEMQIMQRETFGPIVAIQKVRDEDEALRLANDSEYGLGGNIWTTDVERGLRLAAQMETGGVCINDMTMTYGIPEAPFGGVKSSGIGQVNGAQGIRGYCHAHPIVVDRKTRGPLQGGYPYTEKSSAGMRKLMHLLFRTRLGRLFT